MAIPHPMVLMFTALRLELIAAAKDKKARIPITAWPLVPIIDASKYATIARKITVAKR